MELFLRDKTVGITRASSGMGRQIALEFARNGVNLVLLARRQERLETVSSEIGKLGVNVDTYQRDISVQQVQTTFETISFDLQSIHALMNNADVSTKGCLESLSGAAVAFDSDYAVNMRGTLLCTLAAHLLMRGDGAIVNIS